MDVSVDQYLRTTYRPDCDFVDGHIVERNVGKKRHSFAQGRACGWFTHHADNRFEPFVSQRIQVATCRFRVPDFLLMRSPSPDEDVFTTVPYLCLEIMSPDDIMSSMQDRIDDYLTIGVENLWVVDPWKPRAWIVTAQGWQSLAAEGTLTTQDGVFCMPIQELMLKP